MVIVTLHQQAVSQPAWQKLTSNMNPYKIGLDLLPPDVDTVSSKPVTGCASWATAKKSPQARRFFEANDIFGKDLSLLQGAFRFRLA